MLHGSPALFGRLLDAAPDASAGLRTGLVAGAPCPPSVLERLDAAGPPILNVFGMTEIGARLRLRAPTIRPQCATPPSGRALPGYEFRVRRGATSPASSRCAART